MIEVQSLVIKDIYQMSVIFKILTFNTIVSNTRNGLRRQRECILIHNIQIIY